MNDVENRLRDAFAARAALVTPESLRPVVPPARRRSVSRWVAPTVAGLAVTATVAGALVAGGNGDNRSAPLTRPNPNASASASPNGTSEPSASSSPSASPEPSASRRPSPIRSPSRIVKGARVPGLAGWTAVVPKGWEFYRNVGSDPGPGREDACLGTEAVVCVISLARIADVSQVRADVLGANVAPESQVSAAERSGCRLVSGPAPSGRPGIQVTQFHCFVTDVYQLVAPAQGLVAFGFDAPVGHTSGQEQLDVLYGLDIDRAAPPLDGSTQHWFAGGPGPSWLEFTLPASWRHWKKPDGSPGWGDTMCPPGSDEQCFSSGGLLVRDIRFVPGIDPRTAFGLAGGQDPDFDWLIGCPAGDSVAPPASYRVTTDRPVTVAGAKGRYLEATLTCPDGSSRLMRRWYVPKLNVIVDTSGRDPDVDRAMATVQGPHS